MRRGGGAHLIPLRETVLTCQDVKNSTPARLRPATPRYKVKRPEYNGAVIVETPVIVSRLQHL
jgi:hypothetical protein